MMKSMGFAALTVGVLAVALYLSGHFNLSSGSNQAQVAAPNAVETSASAPSLPVASAATPRTIEWEELMPPEDLRLLEEMTPVDHESMSEIELAKDQAPRTNSLRPQGEFSQFEQAASSGGTQARTWKDALVSTRTRPELANQLIKIPGYIVPLEYDAQQMLTGFFLVPYAGACIHVPPPPPNQIIYVRIPKGFPPQDIYMPFWVQGKLTIETKKNDLGISSYSLEAASVEAYQE